MWVADFSSMEGLNYQLEKYFAIEMSGALEIHSTLDGRKKKWESWRRRFSNFLLVAPFLESVEAFWWYLLCIFLKACDTFCFPLDYLPFH